MLSTEKMHFAEFLNASPVRFLGTGAFFMHFLHISIGTFQNTPAPAAQFAFFNMVKAQQKHISVKSQ